MLFLFNTLTGLIFLMACGRSEKFPELGNRIAGPSDVAVSDSGEYFYILNSDFDRSYDQASILVIKEDGSKAGRVEIPRMGRAMHLFGNKLVVMFDREEPKDVFKIHLYDLADDPARPELVRTWDGSDEKLKMNCLPINAVGKANYSYFFVTCSGGALFVGELKADPRQSTLKRVRYYEDRSRRVTRRALHLDTLRGLLLAFPTDFSQQLNTDIETNDRLSFDTKTGKSTEVANEVPDLWEESTYQRRNSYGRRHLYQMLVYDIEAAAEDGFPEIDLSDTRLNSYNKEHRWIYFTLLDGDFTPDSSAQTTDMSRKRYRTNFWTAQPDPTDSNVFYLSHRGKGESNAQFSNNIVKVELRGDPRDSTLKTSQVMSFSRAFGYSGEIDVVNHFPSDFKLQTVEGQQVLVINHFKDYVSEATRNAPYFGITSKTLSGGWYQSIGGGTADLSFFQVAVNQRGKALSCAFYGNAAIPLEVLPGRELKLGWENIKKIE